MSRYVQYLFFLILIFGLAACQDETQKPTTTRLDGEKTSVLVGTSPVAIKTTTSESEEGAQTPPKDCPIDKSISPKNLTPKFGPLIGSTPVYAGVLSTTMFFGLKSRITSAQFGYPQKVLWALEPGHTTTVKLQGANLRDGTPLWFRIVGMSEAGTTGILEPSKGLGGSSDWNDFPSTMYVTKAGCYFVQVTWNTGSWKIVFAAGHG